MHDLFKQVLGGKDLSKAGDLFLLPDALIIPDLPEVLYKIREIAGQETYLNNENDQSVVEICVARVTNCVGELNLINSTCDNLVSLLVTCLNFDLKHCNPSVKYPPHAKIASDVLACLFINYTNRNVMREALPVAVKFLHKGNRELVRNVTCYLNLLGSLENPDLLAKYVQPIIDSVIGGNYPLARVLPQIYTLNRERIQEHIMALACILPKCDTNDKLALLQLFTLVAGDNAMLLEPSLPQLFDCLKLYQTTSPALHVFLGMSPTSRLVAEQVGKIKATTEVNANCVGTVAEVMRSVGIAFKDKSAEALSHLVTLLNKEMEPSSQSQVLREVIFLCQSNPALVNSTVIDRLRLLCSNACHAPLLEKLSGTGLHQRYPLLANNNVYTPFSFNQYSNNVINTNNSVTLIRVNQHHDYATVALSSSPASRLVRNRMELNRARLQGPSLHKSLTKLGHGRPLTLPQQMYSKSTSGMSIPLVTSPVDNHLHYFNPPQYPATRSFSHLTSLASAQTLSTTHSNLSNKASKASLLKGLPPTHHVIQSQPDLHHHHHHQHHRSESSAAAEMDPGNGGNRISVFEPYPMRDTVQHFCEKHLDKIKSYIEKLTVKVPLPVKCTIEERKSRKIAKLHFACQDRSTRHCLYVNGLFTLKTAYPRIWIHIMFLALQSRSLTALSTREPSVSSLKNCWDVLKCENRSFLTLVTSAFPSSRDHESLLGELRYAGYFDLFSFNGGYKQWGCFLCNHPEKAADILSDTDPVIEGEMKEKKGKWRLFKRWRTRYFTLSGGQLSCRDRSSILTTLDLAQIRSVRVARSHRNIPKAFEIFTTEEKTYVLKPKDGKNAAEWVRYLNLLVAHHNQSNKEKPSFGSKSLL